MIGIVDYGLSNINSVANAVTRLNYSYKIISNSKNLNYQCYKLMGYDFLIDENHKVYLGEINVRIISIKFPPKDFKMKMYNDILDIVFYKKTNPDFLVCQQCSGKMLRGSQDWKATVFVIHWRVRSAVLLHGFPGCRCFWDGPRDTFFPGEFLHGD